MAWLHRLGYQGGRKGYDRSLSSTDVGSGLYGGRCHEARLDRHEPITLDTVTAAQDAKGLERSTERETPIA